MTATAEYVSTAPRDPIPVRARDGRSYATLVEAVESDLAQMITVHPMSRALSALALRLAAQIDLAEERYAASMSTQTAGDLGLARDAS